LERCAATAFEAMHNVCPLWQIVTLLLLFPQRISITLIVMDAEVDEQPAAFMTACLTR
jgi:hypothetical protein